MASHPITLEALEILVEIDRRGSFASAAEHLGKVPSALSYSVQKLEEQLGVALFQRSGRRSLLTPAGKLLLAEGNELLLEAARLADRTREVATGWEPKLRIAVDTIVGEDEIFPVLQKFVDQHPQTSLEIYEEVLGGSWEALADDRVDLVVGAGPPVPPKQGIRAEPFGELTMVFALAANHPLTRFPKEIPITEVTDLPWIVVRDTSKFSAPRTTRRIASGHRIYVQTMAQKIAAQASGLGVGYLPAHRIRSLLEEGLMVTRELEGSTTETSETLVAWKAARRGKGLQALAKMFYNQG